MALGDNEETCVWDQRSFTWHNVGVFYGMRLWRSTHLQDAVFREVRTVHCVFHFVFAIKSAQCGRSEMPGDFLLNENISSVVWLAVGSVARTRHTFCPKYQLVCGCRSGVLKLNILYCWVLLSDYSATGHVIVWRKWPNTQHIFTHRMLDHFPFTTRPTTWSLFYLLQL